MSDACKVAIGLGNSLVMREDWKDIWKDEVPGQSDRNHAASGKSTDIILKPGPGAHLREGTPGHLKSKTILPKIKNFILMWKDCHTQLIHV